MICEMCKLNDASLTRTIDRGYGEEKLVLCAVCAKNLDRERTVNSFVDEFWGASSKSLSCSKCKTKLSDIKKTKYVGCCDCYLSFRTDIEGLIVSIQGMSTHIGKIPNSKIKQYRERKHQSFDSFDSFMGVWPKRGDDGRR